MTAANDNIPLNQENPKKEFTKILFIWSFVGNSFLFSLNDDFAMNGGEYFLSNPVQIICIDFEKQNFLLYHIVMT